LSWAILFDATNCAQNYFAAAKIDLVNIEYVLRADGFQQLTEEPGDRKFVRRIRLTGSPTDCGPVYPPCTSLGRIRCFWRFSRLMEPVTYAPSTSLLVRSPPPLPFIFLMDGHLTKRRGGKKGQTTPLVRFFLCEFSAVRVTTGFAGLEVQEASPRTPFVDIGAIRLESGVVESPKR